MASTGNAYLIGGGIGSLAAAAFLIRDCALPGESIFIFDKEARLGGSLDAAGDSNNGYSMRGGRMFTSDNYECTWDLFKTIPSLSSPGQSVYDETLEFNKKYQSDSRARLVDRGRGIVPVNSMGFSMHDRESLLKLMCADEDSMGRTRVTDWFAPAFFATNFWFIWATTFAFEPWHSAVELRRYLHRFILEFSRIDTLAGVKRTIYNQYDSLVRPLNAWLEAHGVHFLMDSDVTALDQQDEGGEVVITGIDYQRYGRSQKTPVKGGDVVLLQNGSMTDSSSIGSMTQAPAQRVKSVGGGWSLWESLARGRPHFGNPPVFNSRVSESWWGSFTVTLQDPAFFDAMCEFSGNEAGTGGLVTFRDSNWLLSIVLPHQPHFMNQSANSQVFWGYSLFGDRIGNFLAKPMADCTGADILKELSGHLRFDWSVFKSANCIPCRMPYITSMFMPRVRTDRPLPVPTHSKNLAFISQFVEIPQDVVFTVEYSIRAAQMAVYQLFNVQRAIPAITAHDKAWRTKLEAVIKAFE
jgi:oleate hydratase